MEKRAYFVIPSSLIPDLRALRPERPAEEVFLYARLIWRFTADHVREIEVHDSDDNTVHPLRDITDFDRCLRQLANAARRAESLQPSMMPVPIANSDAAGSPEAIILNREVRSLTDVSGESGREKDGTEPTE